ncbi:MAG: flavoprotein, partial [Bdellovibrionota bacterium]|nr:flavoprotein [Bdellovibrionota bacterium]
MKILIGVSGSISAYKALDVVRGLTKNGHEVKVIVTSGATKFVVPEVFLYLGALEVFKPEDDFKYPSSYKEVDKLERNPILHIDLARWADQFAILPLSANTLSSLNQGSANDLLTSVFLATNDETPIVLYPAMNQSMLKNPLVQRNLNS